MKAFAVILLIGLAGYFGYTTYFKEPARPRMASTDAYSLKTVESKPVPRKEFFELWTDAAFDECAQPRTQRYIAVDACNSKVRENSGVCAIKVGRAAPSKIGDARVSEDLGKAYVACVVPPRTCGGVEVKTEDDARQYCK